MRNVLLILKLFLVVPYPICADAYLSVIAMLDDTDPNSAVFRYRQGFVWWVINSDFMIVDRTLEETALSTDEYYLLVELAPDHSERIYPIQANRVRRFFDRDTTNRQGGVYIYKVKKCNVSSCNFIHWPIMVFDDRDESPNLGGRFMWSPELIEQVVENTSGRDVSNELRQKLIALKMTRDENPNNFQAIYAIARSIAVTSEYKELILAE